MSGNPDRDFEINTSNNINNINNINNPFNPFRPRRRVILRQQPPSKRYKVQTKLKVDRKMGDYLRLMEKFAADPEAAQLLNKIKLDYQALQVDIQKYTLPHRRTKKPLLMQKHMILNLENDLAKIHHTADAYLTKNNIPIKMSANTIAVDPYTQAVVSIRSMIEKDFRTLQSLQADGKTPLADMVKASKKRTIVMSPNVNMADVNTVGNSINQRMLMSVTTGDNKVQKGVFTQPLNITYEKTVTDFIEQETKRYQDIVADENKSEQEKQDAQQLLDYFKFMKAKRGSAMVADFKEYSLGKFYMMAYKQREDNNKKKYLVPTEYIKDGFVGGSAYLRWEKDQFKPVYEKAYTQYSLYGKRHGLQEGDNIDCRNSAMTDVAELLGYSDLIARSTPMTVKMPNGKTVIGTFMNFAGGTDIHHAKLNDPYFSSKPEDYSNTAALKSVADLQVLDFICGNSDRHWANMLYQFDEEGKFSGVKGIDNDLSFGTVKPSAKSGYLGTIDDIRVVSSDMARCVRELSPDTLTLALRSHGLRQEEIDSAVSRLNTLKDRIDKPVRSAKHPLRIVEDNEWRQISLDDLTKDSVNKRNMFNTIKKVSTGQVELLGENVQRIRIENSMYGGYTGFNHEQSDVDFDLLSDRLGALKDGFSRINMDDLADDDAKTRLENMQKLVDQTQREFQEMKNEPPKTFKMTAKEAQNKIVEYSQKSNQYAFRENEVMEQKVEASKIALRRAMKTPDENGMITFSEPDWEYRQRQKRAAEKKMKALGDLADQYVDAQEKNMPEGADEPFKERTPHEKNIIDAMTLAKSVGQTAETGFQRPEEYHFTGSKMASKDGEDYAELSRKMDGFVMWLEEAETDVYFGSKEYDNMKKYATYMRDELDRMAKAPIPDNAQDAEVQRDVQFNRAQGMMNTMRALSGMYLKRRDLKNDQSNIKTRKRMLAATTLYAFAKNNCDRFDVEAQYDLYRDGLAQERENAFANMKPKQIGTYIKNTIRMANAHKDDPLFVNTAQTELSKYMRLVKNQTAQEVGLSKNDVRDLNKFNKEHPIAPPKDTKEKTMEQTELDGTEMKETNPKFEEDGNSRHSSRTPSVSITG